MHRTSIDRPSTAELRIRMRPRFAGDLMGVSAAIQTARCTVRSIRPHGSCASRAFLGSVVYIDIGLGTELCFISGTRRMLTKCTHDACDCGRRRGCDVQSGSSGNSAAAAGMPKSAGFARAPLLMPHAHALRVRDVQRPSSAEQAAGTARNHSQPARCRSRHPACARCACGQRSLPP